MQSQSNAIAWAVWMLSWSGLSAWSGISTAAEVESSPPQVVVEAGVRIPMRDGIHLGATIYRPAGSLERVPVIVHFTPYTQTRFAMRMWHFLEHGYAVATVDVRGRGNSEGERFKPFTTEGPDGYDLIEWLAQRTWCNGQVAMYGGSYTGWVQWMAAAQFPPHLAVIAPSVPTFPGTDFPKRGNIFPAWCLHWIMSTSGKTDGPPLPWDYWIAKRREVCLNPPFAEADHLVGDQTTEFPTMIQHPAVDAYWDAMCPTDEQYARMNLPALTITGYYDGNQLGALTHFRKHHRLAPAEATVRHFLVIGPWDHGASQVARSNIGGLVMPEASVLDLRDLHRQWYDWNLKDGSRPDFLQKKVAYFVVGAEPQEWKYAASLEAISEKSWKFHLNSDNGQANTLEHVGRLQRDAPDRETGPDHYIYDPLDTSPIAVEGELEAGAYNDALTAIPSRRYAENLFDGGVVYETAPLESDVEITGIPKLVLWISMDVPDTDFIATLHEISPDGQSIQLSDVQLRARYRGSLREEQLVVPGEITRFEFCDFWFFSRRVAKGNRLRLVFRSPNSMHYQRNYNSGGVVADETKGDARVAHVKIYHDLDHPSYLEIPVVPAAPR